MPALITRYVNPDSTAGGDGTTNATAGANRAYVSLQAWETATHQNLVAADSIAEVFCETSGTADTTAVTIAGWTTDATRYIHIKTSPGHRHVGVWNDAKYKLSVTNAIVISPEEDYVIVEGLQLEHTHSSAAGISMLNHVVALTASNNLILYDRCLIKNVPSGGSGTLNLVYLAANDANVQMRNCILYDASADGGGTKRAVRMEAGLPTQSLTLYNCTVHNCVNGFSHGSGTAIATNVGMASVGTPFAGTITQTTCSTTTPTFLDEAGDNFHLSASDVTWNNQGTDLSGTFTLDVDGETRDGTWSIGADKISTGVRIGVGT